MIGLSAVVVFTVLLPLAGASAGPDGSEGEGADPAEAAADPATGERKARQDGKTPSGQDQDPAAEGQREQSGPPVLVRSQCGPEVASPDGVEAQTCVLAQGREVWARTYYRNATGAELDAVLTLMGPAGRTVRSRCAVGADDEPGSCETPHGQAGGRGAEPRTAAEPRMTEPATAAEPRRYAAVSEFASPGEGRLLLRSGSNSAAPTPG
ncbi:hypothetical protein ACIQM4_12165 [Streptomyces sp. NPDC091272]|uniref:hypothetical protein n=1 Tax=Streptomyces sp. NPDC091272 TaxID=3365981 RepID=UPI0038239196